MIKLLCIGVVGIVSAFSFAVIHEVGEYVKDVSGVWHDE